MSEEQQASVAVRCAWSDSVPKHAERRAELGKWCRADCRDAGRQRMGLRELFRGLLVSRATSSLQCSCSEGTAFHSLQGHHLVSPLQGVH